jgi:hypothetical protein
MDDSCYSYQQDIYFKCIRNIVVCCRGKAIRITYTECVSIALLIQHAMLLYLITRIISFAFCMDIQYSLYITL